MCYTCVVFNKILVQVLDINRFQPSSYLLRQRRKKKSNVCIGGHLALTKGVIRYSNEARCVGTRCC